MGYPFARAVGSVLLTALAATSSAWADPQAWTQLEQMPANVTAGQEWVRPSKFSPWELSDLGRLRALLQTAPMEAAEGQADPVPVEIAIPRPDGGFAFFAIVESPVMAAELAAKFPEIKTYRGQGLDDPSANIRLDLTPQGFHASVLGPNGSYYVDPYTRADTVHYVSYYIQDLKRPAGNYQCYTEDVGNQSGQNPGGFDGGYGERTSGTTLRRFDLAMAATGEFTAWHGGTVTAGMAAITTGVNRITQVWENEVAIRFTLVANNNLIVYTNGTTDPYTNSSVSTMLNENQTNCNSVIGSSNYDIGHVVGQANLGGVAQLGVVCGSSKAKGATALGSPTGDYFWVSYVCHEMGHQFSATHSFNSNTSPCVDNRTGSTAYETGGGTTIMSYAGVCGADNVASQSDPYFHTGSYSQILSHASSRSCDTETATGNSVPTANAGADRSIPIGTAFELSGTSTDANGDTLSYCWEQFDTGAAQTLAQMLAADNGSSPIFRNYPPTSINSRSFPRLNEILVNSLSTGNRYPGAARTMDLRFTVRDNRSGGGGVNADTVVLNVVATAGPFVVTSPSAGNSWSSDQTVMWNVANTSASPISAGFVDILLSTDGGATFPIVLASTTPNDGSQVITLPAITTSTARIKVKAVNNYFFDISNGSFTITCPSVSPPTGLTATDGTFCDRVSLAWDSVPGVVDYEIFRGTSPVGAIAPSIGTTASTTFDDTTAAAGTSYFYFVKSRIACGSSNFFSTSDTGFRGGTSAAPDGLSASDSTSCSEVSLAWNALTGVTGYRVVRNSVNDAATGTLVGTTSGTTLSDTAGDPGVTYFYFVRGETASCGSGPYSAADTGSRSAAVAPPTNVAASDGGCASISVSWTAAPGATSYSVWRSTTNNSATAVQIGIPTSSPYSDATALAGSGYFYWVKSVSACGAGAFSANDAGSRSSAPAAPAGVSASDSASCTQVDITWSAAAGATSYTVHRNSTNSNSGATLLATTASLSHADSTAAEGATYFYFVKASNTCGESGFSASDAGTRSAAPVAPASASSDRSNFCTDDAGNITLSTAGGSGSILQWFTDSCGGTPIGTGDGLVIASPDVTTTYFARWENTCGESTCASVTVTVGTAPTAPTLAASNRSDFCPDDSGSITLSATGGSGTTLVWFADSCGSTPIGTGDGLVIDSPLATTTYFARWETDCAQSTCASTVVSVTAAPEAPLSAASNRSGFCADDSGSISLSAIGGSGTTLRWYEGTCIGTSIGSGNPLVIDSPTASTTYFAAWESPCGTSTCESVAVQVEPTPLLTSLTFSGSSPYLQGTSATATVTLAAAAGTSGATVSITSSAFAPAAISIAPGSSSGTTDVVMANTGTSQSATAEATACAVGSVGSVSFDVVGAAATLYVATSGDDGNSGTTAGSPLRLIQTAASRLSPGGLIIVADGLFEEVLIFDRSLTLSGGSAAGTIIDANAFGRVLTLSGTITVELRDCTLTDGSATDGGAIDIPSGASLTVLRCELTNSVASSSGGAIHSQGALSLIESTVADNSAAIGGGIASSGTLTISNSTLANNAAATSGGALSNSGGTADIMFSTFAANTGPLGGAVAVSGGALSIGSSILADSTGASDLSGTVASNGFNLVESAIGSTGLGVTDQTGIDPIMGPLANNGGPTRTVALAPASPAIDAGDPACGLSTDQRGNPRPVDGNADASAVCDVGSFEADGPSCGWSAGGCAADFDGDLDFDSDDVVAFFTEWDNGGDCADTDLDGDADSDDIVNFFTAWDAGGC